MQHIASVNLLIILSAGGIIAGHDAFAVLNSSEEPWPAPPSAGAQRFPPAICNPNPCPDLSLIWLLIFSPDLSGDDFTRVKNLIKKSSETCMLHQRKTKVYFLSTSGPIHWTPWSSKEFAGFVQLSDFTVETKPNEHMFAQILEEAVQNLTTNWAEKHLYVITDFDLALAETDARSILESLHRTECTLRYMQLPSPTGASSSVEDLVKNNLGIITDTILISLKTIEDIGLFNSEFLPCEDDPNDIIFPEGPFKDEGHFGSGPGMFMPDYGPFGPGPAGPFPGPRPFEPDMTLEMRHHHQGHGPLDYPIPGETGGPLIGPLVGHIDPSTLAASAANTQLANANAESASNNLLVLIIGLLALVLLALSSALIYCALRRKREKKQAQINANMLRTIENGIKTENHYSN